MNNNQKDDVTLSITKLYRIVNDIKQNLECDLYVCFEGDEEIKKLEKKKRNIRKIKKQIIKLYGAIISEC
jgi:hypothetical protein